MRWESSGVVGFDLRPLLEGEMRTAKLKSAYNSLIIGPRGFGALSLRWIQFDHAKNLCFAIFGKNSKIQNGRHFWGGENFLKIVKITFLRYPVGRKV